MKPTSELTFEGWDFSQTVSLGATARPMLAFWNKKKRLKLHEISKPSLALTTVWPKELTWRKILFLLKINLDYILGDK